MEAFLETKIPQSAIWNLLTRDERRKFFVDGYVKLIDGKADLLTRCKSRGGKNVDKLENEIIDILRNKDNIRFCDINHGNEIIESVFIYGAEYRQHILCRRDFYRMFWCRQTQSNAPHTRNLKQHVRLGVGQKN